MFLFPVLWRKEEETESWELWGSWTEYFNSQPSHKLPRRSSGYIDTDDDDDDDDDDDEHDDDDDAEDDDVQAEGWIAGEGEKEVESGPIIADDHIYQSA